MSEFNVDVAIKHRDQYYLYMSTGASGLQTYTNNTGHDV